MTSVALNLPDEIIRELDLPYEGFRDVQAIVLAIEGVNAAASVVVGLAALSGHAQRFVEAVRRWRLRQPKATMTMVVKGPAVDLRIELPPNVSTADLLDQLRPLLTEPERSIN